MKEQIIYWSGDMGIIDNSQFNWNILYETPQDLYKEVSKNINAENNTPSFIQCSGFQSLSKHTFILNNPLESSYKIHNGNFVEPVINSSMSAEIVRNPTLKDCILLKYNFPTIFFSEEKIVMTATPPYMHKTKHSEYGFSIPGRFDISSWFRPYSIEFNLWPNIDKFYIPENDPISYISFDTDKKIKFIKFEMSDKLSKVMNTCSKAGEWEPRVSLQKRYMRFHNSMTNKLVIKEIKKNIIG